MEGYINMTAVAEEGLKVECHLARVNFVDKMQLIEAVSNSVHLSKEEFMKYVVFKDSGLLDQIFTKQEVEFRIPKFKEDSENEG